MMDLKKIQAEVDKISRSTFATKTDKQLVSYELLSELHKNKYKGVQPPSLVRCNNRAHRKCMLTLEQVEEIKSLYNPHVMGKYLLSKKYNVSPTTIWKIINGRTWK